MLFGDDPDILTILWGPGRPAVLDLLRREPQIAAQRNGLLEALVGLSNLILVDTTTIPAPFGLVTDSERELKTATPRLAHTIGVPDFSEHDIDTVLHGIFASDVEAAFESMCNPPGGDWSGCSLLGTDGMEYRWTSLPRVSGVNSKRPDHVVQFRSIPVVLLVESKTKASDLEVDIGPRMSGYARRLFTSLPTTRRPTSGDWELMRGGVTVDLLSDHDIGTVGAFVWRTVETTREAAQRGQLDAAIGIEFLPDTGEVVLHVVTQTQLGDSIANLVEALATFNSRIKVQKY
jgi:hypothetical protein